MKEPACDALALLAGMFKNANLLETHCLSMHNINMFHNDQHKQLLWRRSRYYPELCLNLWTGLQIREIC